MTTPSSIERLPTKAGPIPMHALIFFSLVPFLLLFATPSAGDERVLTGHSGEIFALALSPNDQLLASAGSDRAIRLWEPITGREMRSLNGHLGSVRALAFAKTRSLLASGGSDSTIRIWDPAS